MARHPLSAPLAAAVALLACASILAPVAAAEGGSRGLFWKATSGDATVYLLGSIHIADESVYPLSHEIEAAYRDSTALVVEADIGPSAQTSLQALVLKMGLYTDGTTLENHLSPEALSAARTFISSRGLPWANLKTMRPWLLAATLTVTEMGRLGLTGGMGIDRHFLDRAAEDGRKVLYLETAEEQTRMLAELPDALQELMLSETLLEIGKIGESVRTILDAWRSGNDAALERAMHEDFADPRFRPLFKKVFTDRNTTMTAKIRDYMKKGGTWFVVVGSGHMVGDTGIVSQLRKTGVKVEKIPDDAAALRKAS